MPSDLLGLLAGRRGHFRMESGYHSELWFNLDKLLKIRSACSPSSTISPVVSPPTTSKPSVVR
jgi:hypothetical protein